MDLLVTTASWVWFGIFLALAGWSPPIFRLPAYLWPCICSPVWISLWLQPHGLVWYIQGSSWMVSPYFQTTCLPLALHLFTCTDLLVTTASWVWFGIFRALAGWSPPIFRLPAYLWPCICSPVWISLWLQPHGLVWYIQGSSWIVSPYFQTTCLPLALHLFTCMDLLATTASKVWFGISMALAGWSPPIFRLPAYLWPCICSPVWIYPWLQPHGRELASQRGTWRGRSIQVPQKRQFHEILSNSCYFHVKNNFSWWQTVTTIVADPDP